MGERMNCKKICLILKNIENPHKVYIKNRFGGEFDIIGL